VLKGLLDPCAPGSKCVDQMIGQRRAIVNVDTPGVDVTAKIGFNHASANVLSLSLWDVAENISPHQLTEVDIATGSSSRFKLSL